MNSSNPHAITDFFRAARRRKLLIIISLLVFTIAASLAVKQLPKVYESAATVAIEQPENQSLQDRASTDLRSQIAALRQQATTKARLESVIAKQQLFSDQLSKGASLDELISQVRSNISVVADAGRENVTGAFIISYRATDPETAQKITAELAEQLVSESAKAAPAQPQSTDKTDALRQRALQLVAQLHELEQKAPWLVTSSGYTSVAPSSPAVRAPQYSADAARAQQMNIESLRDQQYKIQQQIADLEQRITSQRQIVEQQKKGGSLRNSPTYAALIARRTELEGQRDTLINRQELTDKHPRVVAIIDQINAINRQIEELRQQEASNISQTAEARELASLESERTRLKLDLEIADREIMRRSANQPAPIAPQTPSPVARTQRDPQLSQEYAALKKSYDDVMTKLESAESKQPASTERLILLEAANLPAAPVSSNYLLFISINAAAGLALGAIFAVAAERRRLRSLQTAKDVEYYARMPLLAAIPRTLTDAERRRASYKARLKFVFATAFAACATFALAKIFIITEIFSLIAKK